MAQGLFLVDLVERLGQEELFFGQGGLLDGRGGVTCSTLGCSLTCGGGGVGLTFGLQAIVKATATKTDERQDDNVFHDSSSLSGVIGNND